MPSPLQLSYSRVYPVRSEHAFAATMSAPLTELFSRRYLAIPPIREVRDQQGAWGTPGQTRTIVLADGGTMREELRTVERPRSFGYRLTGIRGPMAALVGGVDGRWSFEADGGGTRVTWSWTVSPRSRLAGPLMPVFARLWRGSARQAFDELGAQLQVRAHHGYGG